MNEGKTGMVEAVARAIYAADICDLNNKSNYTWEDHLPAARAAIEAMREPTEAMEEAGEQAIIEGGFKATEAWNAMIDAALKEG